MYCSDIYTCMECRIIILFCESLLYNLFSLQVVYNEDKNFVIVIIRNDKLITFSINCLN